MSYFDRLGAPPSGGGPAPPGTPIKWVALGALVDLASRVFAQLRPEPAPPAVAMLGLSWPCSGEDVRRRYRQLAHVAHPDAGGSGELFEALKALRDRALAEIEARQKK